MNPHFSVRVGNGDWTARLYIHPSDDLEQPLKVYYPPMQKVVECEQTSVSQKNARNAGGHGSRTVCDHRFEIPWRLN